MMPSPGVQADTATWRWGDGPRYGLLGLPLAFCALLLYVHMPNLYAREWGVPLAALGAVLLAARLADALIDPLIGRWCDRLFAASLTTVLSASAAAAVVLALGFAALFLPWPAEPNQLLMWAGVWLVVTYAAYSWLSVAHQSWGAMLGGDAVYRSRVVAWREGLGLAGVMFAAVATTWLGVTALPLMLVVGLVAGLGAWRLAPRPAAQPARLALSSNSLWQPWRHLAFRRLLVVYLLNGTASAIPATLVLFFVQDRLQANAAMQSAALGVYFACGAVSMPLWLAAVKRWGLPRAWRAGMVLSIVVFIGASRLGAGDAGWFLLVCALSGTALGSDLAVPTAMLAGLIDRAGDRGRAEGAYFGWWNFATKLNLALAAGLALPLLAWLGYTPGARDAQATQMLTAAYCLLPCALKALAVVALQRLLIPHHHHFASP